MLHPLRLRASPAALPTSTRAYRCRRVSSLTSIAGLLKSIRPSRRRQTAAAPLWQMKLAEEQRKARADLAGQRIREAKTLADLKVEKAGIDGQRKVAEADLGPVRYLATLIGAGDQDVLRWFILVVALLLDPAAVLLLLAASSAKGGK